MDIDFSKLPQIAPTAGVVGERSTLLVWHNGNTAADTSGKGLGRFTTQLIGLTTEAGRDARLDEACRSAGVKAISIRHQSSGNGGGAGGGNQIKEHWWFDEEATLLYPLTTGPKAPTVGAVSGRYGNADLQQGNTEAAVGARWPETDPYSGGRGKSQSAVKVLVKRLVDVGYLEPLQWGCSSFNADRLLVALIDHCNRVAPAAAKAVGLTALFPAILALPVGSGQDYPAGSGEKTTMVTPPVSLHPKEITREYVESIFLNAAHWELAETLYREAIGWARSYTAPRDPRVTALDGPDTAPKRLAGGASIEMTAAQFAQALREAGDEDTIRSLQQSVQDHFNARRLDAQEKYDLDEAVEQRLEGLGIAAIPF